MYPYVPIATTGEVEEGGKATSMEDPAQAGAEDCADPVSFDPRNGSVLALRVC